MRGYKRVVVCGDVDSGKSTLIGRLLYETGSFPSMSLEAIRSECRAAGREFEFAYLLDSFEEERTGQYTLDTTQAFCRGPGGQDIMFIDVPGHRELLNNMLTGTSYAESALFVIDPCRPVREQAARHMSILKFLGIGRIIPLVNKMDSVEFRRISFEKIRNDLVSFSRELGLCLDRIIPVAAREGDNLAVRSDRMGWYKGPAVLRTLEGRAHKKTDNAFRFVIQDVYQLESERAAVGTIVSGKVKKGARVNLLPSGRKLRIERIRLFEKPVGSAHAPQSAGLTCDTMEGVARGQILCGMKVPEVTRDFSARICCVRECDTRGRFELRIVYQKTSARFVKIGTVRTIEGACAPAGASLKAFDMCGAVIAADDPVVIEGVNELSRFVLKDHAGICAVGICEERVKRKK